MRAISGKKERYTIARSRLSWVTSTILKDFEEILEMYKIPYYPKVNPRRPDQTYFVNGTEFAFFGLDYPEKLHGRKQDWFWLNEVMEIDQKSFDQLEMRTTKGAILDFNPYDDEHWVFDLNKRPDVAFDVSTMLDNPFLPQSIIDKIKSYEPTQENIERGTADSYMWEVYGLGKPAKLQGAVFENWDIVDGIPSDAKDIGLGLDFGYTNDPTALVDLYLYNNELYLDELIYEKGLKNASPNASEKTIVSKLKELGIGLREITADSSERKSIDEIRAYGFNINGADKGPDSVIHGINFLKGYKMHITRRSINLEKELRRYKWSEDKNGKSLNVPIDDFNHILDATRYRVTKALLKNTQAKLLPRIA
jgi:phage terminase large subunit